MHLECVNNDDNRYLTLLSWFVVNFPRKLNVVLHLEHNEPNFFVQSCQGGIKAAVVKCGERSGGRSVTSSGRRRDAMNSRLLDGSSRRGSGITCCHCYETFGGVSDCVCSAYADDVCITSFEESPGSDTSVAPSSAMFRPVSARCPQRACSRHRTSASERASAV